MIPKTMHGVALEGHGGLEQLRYREDLPVPRPAPGEVLVQIAAAAINNTDINLRTGWYSKAGAQDAGWGGNSVSFPRIQGADACGRIVEVGTGVNAARVGERVIVNPLFSPECYFGSDCDGAFAQFAVVPLANACRIESPLTDVELASFPCSYSTAENLLTRAQVTAGETVLVTGSSGGVGSAVVQLAKRRGARVVAITSEDKHAALESLGADQVLARDANLAAALGRESVHVVIDVVGGTQFPALLDVVRRGGRYAASGAIAGPIVDLDLRTLYLKDLSLFGCTQLEPQVFANLVRYIERAEIEPLVAATFPLREIAAAQTAFLSKTHVGKIVLLC